MRIALISDIHGNRIALQAVLRDVAKAGVDQLFFLGDVATLGPDPTGSIELLHEQNCVCILGNHDEFMLNPKLAQTYTQADEILTAIDWCRDRLSADHLDFLRSFKPFLPVELGAGQKLLLFHGSPRSHMEVILSTTESSKLDEIFSGHDAQIMAGGHTHIQMLRQHKGALILNPGSVGSPFVEFVNSVPKLLPEAEYAILEVKDNETAVSLKRVPLDRRRLIEAAEASDCPMRDWLIGEYRSW